MDKVIVYSWGLVAISACVKKGTPKKEIEAEVNMQHPTGIRSKWELSKDKKFSTGQDNPCQCEDHEDRQHYLLNC